MKELGLTVAGAVVGVLVKVLLEFFVSRVPRWCRKLLDLAVLPPPQEHRRRRRGKRRGSGRGNGWRSKGKGYGVGEGEGETLGA